MSRKRRRSWGSLSSSSDTALVRIMLELEGDDPYTDGIGPMILSPLSEVPAIGRNPIYMATLFLFVILQIPAVTTSNYSVLMAMRFLTGFVGSPALATGGASLADIWAPM